MHMFSGQADTVLTLIATSLGVFAASVLRGFTGFGFGLAAVPLLSLALPPAKVVPLVVVLQVMVGAAGLRAASRMCDWGAIRGLSPGLLLGVPIGLTILTAFSANSVRLAIGLVILASVLLLWRGARLPRRGSHLLAIATGLVGGVMSGLASMGGPPIIVYLLALSRATTVVRATSIVYFMLASMLSLTLMAWKGLVDHEILLWSVASVPMLLAGNYAGTWGFQRSRPQHHRTAAQVTLIVLAVMLIVRSFTG